MTTPTTTDRLAEVLDCDREAAAQLYLILEGEPYSPNDLHTVDLIRAGKLDHTLLTVQAFARHRAASIQSQQAEIERMRGALSAALDAANSFQDCDGYEVAAQVRMRIKPALNPQPGKEGGK